MILKTLQTRFPQFSFTTNESLAKHTPVGIGGPAEVFFRASATQDLTEILKFCQEKNIQYTVIGWGANTLFADRGIKGLVIKNQAKEIFLHQDKNSNDCQQVARFSPKETITTRWQPLKKLPISKPSFSQTSPCKIVSVAAGAPLPWVINYLLEHNLLGLEHFSRIPATIGGAIYNNIHGNQYFISQFVTQVKVFSPTKGIELIKPQNLDFAYDYSRFHQTQEIILTVTFQLKPGDKNQAKKTIANIVQQKIHQPTKSLGCVWKNLSEEEKNQHNLPTASVGYLIDKKLNLAGLRSGDAQVSPKHAAFIENLGAATAQDYLAVMSSISQKAWKQMQLVLKPEIFFKGFTKAELAGLNLKRDNSQ